MSSSDSLALRCFVVLGGWGLSATRLLRENEYV